MEDSQDQGTNLAPSPADPLLRTGFCVNCEATRELTKLGDCSKCGSGSIWTANAVRNFHLYGILLTKEEDK